MTDNRNLPSMDQSWSSAEKMLDRHFRKRRIMAMILAIIIPATIVSIVYFMNHPKQTAEKSMVAVETNVAAQANSSASGVELNKTNVPVENSSAVKIDHSTEVASVSKNEIQFVKPKPGTINSEPVGNPSASNVTVGTIHSNSNLQSSGESPAIDNMSPFTASANEEIALLSPFAALVNIPAGESSMKQKETKKFHTACMTKIGYEMIVYGGASYVQKNLSVDQDQYNYLQHRQNEEDPIVTPMVGLAFSANKNGLKLSAGFEYSSVGEKTNYYPYSNQLTITDNSNWQTFWRSVVDIDTAYVTGNQYFLRTTYQEQDSAFVTVYDSTLDYKYDQRIAETNGVNHIYYVEMPIMVSYALNKGRFGFGVSGGLSPAMQVTEEGYYLRKDGTGVESLQEIKSFRKFIVNGRVGVDFYYRAGGRTMLMLQPLFKANLNSVFEDDYGVNQKYYSTGVLFGVSYMLN